jgi:hypothetical protein
MANYTEYSQENRSRAEVQREGPIARKIEQQTAKLPSDLFLWAAGAAIAASLTLEVMGILRRQRRGILRRPFDRRTKMSAPLASFVGLWAPSLLLLGIYNKIVKVAGSDRAERW